MRKTFTAGICAGVMVLGGISAASALPDDIAEMHAPPGTFYLDSESDTETIELETAQALRVCASANTPAGAVGPEADDPISLKVEVDGSQAMMVMPGDCVTFQAKKFTVGAAEDIPQGWTLEGNYDADIEE